MCRPRRAAGGRGLNQGVGRGAKADAVARRCGSALEQGGVQGSQMDVLKVWPRGVHSQGEGGSEC